MNFLQNEAFFICSSMNFQKMPISRGGHEGGEGGDISPLAFKEGEEEEDVFGPVGPKNMKKMDINCFFANFRNSKGF